VCVDISKEERSQTEAKLEGNGQLKSILIPASMIALAGEEQFKILYGLPFFILKTSNGIEWFIYYHVANLQ
jgi:hypothetical protein